MMTQHTMNGNEMLIVALDKILLLILNQQTTIKQSHNKRQFKNIYSNNFSKVLLFLTQKTLAM